MMKIINNHRPLTLMGKHLGRIDGVRWDGVSLIKGHPAYHLLISMEGLAIL